MRKYKALIMIDYEGGPTPEWIKTGEKTIETRHRSFNYRGDIVMLRRNKFSLVSMQAKHYALWKIRDMQKGDEKASGEKCRSGIKSLLLRNWLK